MRNSPLTDFDYDFYNECLDFVETEGVRVVHTFNKGTAAKGGFTIAYRQHVLPNGKPGKQVDVSVSYCSEKDYFCRKIGFSQAVAYFMDGTAIRIPVGDEDSAVTVARLRAMFDIHGEYFC